MLIGIFSDIHGNSLSFDKCLEDAYSKNIEKFFFLGDAVNYYPDSNTVIDILKKNNFTCIKGNHDHMILNRIEPELRKNKIYNYDYTINKINSGSLNFISSWNLRIDFDLECEDKITMVHGSPADLLNGYIYPDTKLEFLEDYDFNYLFCGHTHIPFIKQVCHKKFVINVGSVGMPRDIGNKPSYVTFDTITKKITIERIVIDSQKIKNIYSKYLHKNTIDLLNR